MLRITDILIRNLIWLAIMEDGRNIMHASTEHIDLLLEKVRECGVTFRVHFIEHEHA